MQQTDQASPAPGAEARPYPEAGRYVTLRGPGVIVTMSPDFRMSWKEREYVFEWGRYGGPILLRRDGEPRTRPPGERHPFWDGIDAWVAAGKKADPEGRCIIQVAPGSRG